ADEGDFGPAEPGHGGAEDADSAGPEHENAVSGFDAGVFDDGVVGDAAGFGEASLLEGEMVGHAVEDAGGHAHVAGHGSVDAVAEAFAGGVEIVKPLAGHGVVGADNGGRLGHDAVPFFPMLDRCASLDDVPSELVPE